MNDLISIIVPVYNVEKYLNRCIDSIINQTYKNIEIILVDDGSTDDSGKICDEYLIKEPRVKVLHKSNGGLSSARNAGIDICKGRYIGFVDSDDWIESTMYEILYKKMIYFDADIIDCGYWKEYVNISSKISSDKEIVYCGKNLVEACYLSKVSKPEVWCKLYKRYIFDSVKFPLNKYYEDAFIFIPTLTLIKKIVIIPSCLYHYRQRKSAITKNIFNDKHLDVIELHENEYQYIKKHMPNCIEQNRVYKILGIKELLFKLLNANKKIGSVKNLQEEIKKNFFFILKTNKLKFKEKISLILIIINLDLFFNFTRIKRERTHFLYFD